MMYYKSDTRLIGLKFYNRDDDVLLTAGVIDILHWKKKSTVFTKTFELWNGERIIGLKSGKRGNTYARHYDL